MWLYLYNSNHKIHIYYVIHGVYYLCRLYAVYIVYPNIFSSNCDVKNYFVHNVQDVKEHREEHFSPKIISF